LGISSLARLLVVQAFWPEVAIRIVLILAVFIDQRRRSVEERM
jgi:ribose transport system permease protein